MWRYAGHVLGILPELCPKTFEEQREFMLASMLHQGVPSSMPEQQTKDFVRAFSENFSRRVPFGLISEDTFQEFFLQMIVYLNGSDHVAGVNITDHGESHWSVRLVKALGFTFGTVMPQYVPFGFSLLFTLHTYNIRRALEKRGTPTGHGAGSGQVPGAQKQTGGKATAGKAKEGIGAPVSTRQAKSRL